jgi:formate dehydrogenase major subunit
VPLVRINDVEHSFPDGLSILDALRDIGVKVPTLCHDDRLEAMGGCRLCVVEVDGASRPVAACTTLLADKMVIRTHTPEIESHRRTLLQLLARDYPDYAVESMPHKEFHQYLRAYGVTAASNSISSKTSCADSTHPYIQVDMSRCITCFRCVRICSEVQGQDVWQVWERGDRTAIVPDSGTTLLESSCVSCGACVDTCPTGALEDKSIIKFGQPTDWTRTTCPYCGTACEMQVGVANERMIAVRPEPSAPVNHGHLCVKGRYAFEFVYSSTRVTEPMLRAPGGSWQPVTWDVAIAHVAEKFKNVVARFGPAGIGVLGSARATNEENFLAQKFARVVLNTNNVDCCARVCHAPTAAAMRTILGTGAATNSFDDIEKAKTILLAGSNATENHPIIGARIRQAVRHGAKLIVIDPREIELAECADVHLQLHPGTNVLLFNAMAATIVEEGLIDSDFIRDRSDQFQPFAEFVGDFAPEKVTDRCGVPAELIRRAARLYATHKPAMCLHGLGMTEHVQGTEGVMCLVNLAILTGNVGKPGTGINPLRGQNNVQGSAQMGCEPNSLTGFVPLAANRESFEAIWRLPVPSVKGLNLLQMVDAAQQGTFKAMWAIGYDVLLTNANTHSAREAMRQLECVVVQDMFLNKTAEEFGTVFLPSCSSFEKDGTFMNAERRIQRVRKAIEPIGNSKSDWEIICMVAKAMGSGAAFEYTSAEQIWNEVRKVWKAVAGISYARIEAAGLQWPCPTEDHAGTRVLHGSSFPTGPRAVLQRVDHRPSREVVSDEFPFMLITGRTLYHFNAGTMTHRTANTELHPHDFLEIAPSDAARLSLANGASVTIRSRHGEATLVTRLNDNVREGELFCTFHDPTTFVNHVTSPDRDSIVSTPEYKVTAVQLAKVNA